MVAGAFPIAKLAYLAMKQISKPIANSMKTYAKRNTFFRNYVCLPPAQFYHWAETTIKMSLMGLGKPTKVAPLNEQMAVELGAELMGETIVFVMAAATIFLEYSRQMKNTKAKEDLLTQRLDSLEDKVKILINLCEQQDQRVREMNKHLHSSLLKNVKEKFSVQKFDDEIESEFKKLGRSLEADKRKLLEEAEKAEQAEKAEKRWKKKAEGHLETTENRETNPPSDKNQLNLPNHVTPTNQNHKQTGIENLADEKRGVVKNFGHQNDLYGLSLFQRIVHEASNLILGEDKIVARAQNPNPSSTITGPGASDSTKEKR